ncbi:MAG: polysaccharide deacetylase family protein [Patescibacteria group bacterium]
MTFSLRVVVVASVLVLTLVSIFFVSGYQLARRNEENTLLIEASILPTATEQLPSVVPTTVSPTPTPVNNNNFSLDYDYPPTTQKSGTVRIPILTYHHIAELPEKSSSKPYYVTPIMFERQLQYLKDKNYKVVTAQEFYELLKKGKNPSQKTVMLTFDDGSKDNYKNAYPLLKKYGFPGVFYINSSKLQITKTQLKEMSDNGMSIESHTASHKDLKKITDQSELESEIIGSKYAIEKITGRKVYSVSYPGCTYNDRVVDVAVMAGYKFGVTCSKYIDHYPSRLFALSRMHIYNDFTNFKKRLSGYWIIP